MVRIFPTNRVPPVRAILTVKNLSRNCKDVFYLPLEKSLVKAGLDFDRVSKDGAKLLHVNGQDLFLTIFPINTTRNIASDFMNPKYGQIERITLEYPALVSLGFKNSPYEDDEMAFLSKALETQDDVIELLEELPSEFAKDYEFGLGLNGQYRFIVNAVEEFSNCTEIVISESCPTGIADDRERFFISAKDFYETRKELDRITNNCQQAARSVKDATVYNIFAEKIGLPEKIVKSGRNPLRKFFTAVAQDEEPLSEDQQEEMLRLLTKNTERIAKDKPEKLTVLKREIELATLDRLIEQYESMMSDKSSKEKDWQLLLSENAFILNLGFGYPVIKVQDQASVGGRKLSGKGDKIADFLVKNSMTNNTTIIEIKTPREQLLNKQPFREGVYTSSAVLSGSINQVLAQKHQFQRSIANIKEDSKVYDIESYSVHCCLIIGTMPSRPDQQKSFELFRCNSKDVEIITFDELLEKLKQLRNFLVSEDPKAVS